MLTWVALLAAIGALVVGGRWLRRRRDELGRPIAFPWASVLLLGWLSAGSALPGALRVHEEHRLAAAASVLAGAPVRVHCQSFGEAFVDAGAELGYVKWGADGRPEHATLIKRAQCGDLSAYLGSSKSDPSLDQIIAVHVLTHESMHMSGITSESQAECAAVQRDVLTAELLGATPAQADRLELRYWREVYPQMPEGYTTGDCTAGGPLDEHLATSPWNL